MKIANIMSRDVHFIGPYTTLREAAKKMKQIDSGALPVAEHDKLVGMLTDPTLPSAASPPAKAPTLRSAMP